MPSEKQKSLFKHVYERFSYFRGSIFPDGLVAGMFLLFLIHTHDACHDDQFVDIFFYIGISHFICNTVRDLSIFAIKSSAFDKRVIWRCKWVILLVLRFAQYCIVIVLGYYSLKFSVLEADSWTFDKISPVADIATHWENCTKCYCEDNYVRVAQVTVCFQCFSGVIQFATWVSVWCVETQFEKSTTCLESIFVSIMVLGTQTLFNTSMASTVFELSVTMPHENCHLNVMSMFLYIGLIKGVKLAVLEMRGKVEEIAYADGIFTKAEYYILQSYKLFNFLLFISEFLCYILIVKEVVLRYKDVRFDSMLQEFYCGLGIWRILLVVTGLFGIIFMVKVFVIIRRLWIVKKNFA